MRYTVRDADSADVAALAELRWRFRTDEQPLQDRTEFLDACETWLHRALQSGRWTIAIAVSETGAGLGCMYLQYVEKVPVPGGIDRAWGYITNSYVTAESRGIGVGRKLLERLITNGKARKLEFLIVWPSKEAVSFYQRAGFRHVGDVHSASDDEPPLELPL